MQPSMVANRVGVLPTGRSMPTPEPTTVATLVLLAGLFLTAASLGGNTASGVACHGAIGCGVSLALSLVFEAKKGIQNLLRADLIAIFALYFLLFFVFLFPQSKFDELVPYPEAVLPSVRICLLAFVGIAVGRHCIGRNFYKWDFVWRVLSHKQSHTILL